MLRFLERVRQLEGKLSAVSSSEMDSRVVGSQTHTMETGKSSFMAFGFAREFLGIPVWTERGIGCGKIIVPITIWRSAYCYSTYIDMSAYFSISAVRA